MINLAAARSPSGDFPDTLPTWTLTAPDGADELPYEPGAAFDYTAQTPGVYVFTAKCGEELEIKVVVTDEDSLVIEDRANAENTAVTTDPADPQGIYVAYVEDEQENPVTEVKLTAVPAPGTDFASGEPEWTVAAVPDGVDAESIDLPEDGEASGDVLLPALGEYAFTAEWDEIELTVEVVTLKVDILSDTNRDGVIDEEDQEGNDEWKPGRGAIVMVNYNRDGDRTSNDLRIPDSVYINNGQAQNIDNKIRDEEDVKDIAPR